jgi:hypothetical protein
MKIRFFSQSKYPKVPVDEYANIFRAISTGERDIGILLHLLDQRLRILEQRPYPTVKNIKSLDFTTDAEAVVILKALYIQIRIYLDAIAGVIRYFHRRTNLPKSFDDLLKKLGTKAIPSELSQVLSSAPTWFKTFKETRDDLVHRYEDFLLLFSDKENEKAIHHASLSRINSNRAFDYGSIKTYFGELLRNIQVMVDNLLDYFDTQFYKWYGFVQSSTSRTQTILEGGHGYMLYWAHKYGGYSHSELHLRGDQS